MRFMLVLVLVSAAFMGGWVLNDQYRNYQNRQLQVEKEKALEDAQNWVATNNAKVRVISDLGGVVSVGGDPKDVETVKKIIAEIAKGDD